MIIGFTMIRVISVLLIITLLGVTLFQHSLAEIKRKPKTLSMRAVIKPMSIKVQTTAPMVRHRNIWAQQRLEQFLNDELDKIDPPFSNPLCLCLAVDESCLRSNGPKLDYQDKVDHLAVRLNELLASDADNKVFYDGLKDVLDFEEFAKLQKAFEPEEIKPQPIENDNESGKNLEQVEKTLKHELDQLPDDTDKEYLLQVWSQAYPDDQNNKAVERRESPMIGFAKFMCQFLNKCVQFGVSLLDSLYMAPDFVKNAPMLGHMVTELQQRGEPLYKLVKLVRYAHFTAKVSLDKEGNPIDGDKLAESKRFLSDVGLKALNNVASKMVEHFTGVYLAPEEYNEVVSRAATGLLTVVLPKHVTCQPEFNK